MTPASGDPAITALLGTDINRYSVTKYLGSGSFGHVFEARNRLTDETVALKVPILNDQRDGQQSLLDEAKVYKYISCREHGVPNMKITQHKERKIIVMDLLGPSLEQLLAKHKKFRLKTVIRLAIVMIDILRYVHGCGFIHRDIKPDNFAVSTCDDGQPLFLIDYGLAKRYVRKNGEHVEFNRNRRFLGTARFASTAAHMHHEQSRKDDLETLAYVLVYLYKGKLPWQGVKVKDKRERYALIGKRKMATSPEELCSGMPREFVVFLNYVKNLDFDEKPHYSALRNMFHKLYSSRNYKTDKFEWNT